MHWRSWLTTLLLTGAAAALAVGFFVVSASANQAASHTRESTGMLAASRHEVRGARLSLVAEPAAGSRPFIKLIEHARRSVELTMYELYDKQVQGALGAAAKRGVNVRVILNGGYYGDSEDRGSGENGPAFSYLRRHRVHVRWAPAYFALTHQKTLTVDGAASAIMTLNFDGQYASTRDFAVIDRRTADVRTIVSTFDADWSRRKTVASSGTGDLIWSPGAASAFTKMISGARRTLDVEDEEMGYAPVTDDLCAAARRHVKVHVVMTYDSDWKSAFAYLRRCGVKVHLFHGQSYYIHAKVVIADGTSAIVSSQNFSTTSLDYNRELGIRMRTHRLVAALGRDFTADFKRS